MNILLIIIVAVLALSLLGGYKNGFLKTVFSLISWIIVLVVCNIATPMVTEILVEKTEIDTTLQTILDAKINEIISSAVAQSGVEELAEVVPEDIISELPAELQAVLPEEVKNLLANAGNFQGITLDASAIDTSAVINSIMGIISLLLVMIVVRIALLVIELALGIASKLPLIGPVDKILGFICGAGKGFIWSWILLAVVAVLAATGINTEFAGYISESQFLTWLQENNLILNLIVK